jgi:hypothetical protein
MQPINGSKAWVFQPFDFPQGDSSPQFNTIFPEFPDFINSMASLNSVYGKR